MKLFFIDESGSPVKAPRQVDATSGVRPYPLYILAATAIDEKHRHIVEQWISRTKESFFGVRGDRARRPEYEIKGSLLYALRLGRVPPQWGGTPKRKKDRAAIALQKAVWGGLSPSQLEQLEISLFDLFDRIECEIFAVVVDQQSLYAKYGNRTWRPDYWALTYLQQRAVQYIEARWGRYEQGIFIMDEMSNLSHAEHFEQFLKTRREINETTSWPADFRVPLIDMPLPAKSHLMEPLQMADLAVHAIWKHVRKSDSLGWFKRIEHRLATNPRTGDYFGAGLAFIRAR